ncbi:MAG: hypothetical protein Kow00107_09080 [Planctomycetota bacterium]
MNSTATASLLLSLLVTLSFATAEEIIDDRGIPLSARQYIVDNYMKGVDPLSQEVDDAFTILRLPPAIRAAVESLEWEKGQLQKFEKNKLFGILRCPDGSIRAIHFRDGKKRNDRKIDESRLRVLQRLYSDDSFTSPPDPILVKWQAKEVDPKTVLFDGIAKAHDNPSLRLDGETIRRALKNLMAEKTRSVELSRALGALAESENSDVNCWAAVWLISRMDVMMFARKQRELSVPDLEAIDAQTFYENVFYAVKARMEFPWAKEVPEKDFLHQVLSPRSTNEPLQRWRRHFYDALSPEVAGLTIEDMDKVRAVAANAYGDYYQYEGDTTWEDFGMLTSLAVHEGRCEDCSNVLNSMYRALGIPACQAFTPMWGHCDGNHAWTWIRGGGDVPGDGRNAVKVYVKTWDGLEDVTSEYTPVTTVEIPTEATTSEKAQLMVWNSGDWHVVARSSIADGKAVFANVGCRLDFVLCVRIPGGPERLVDVRKDGSVRTMKLVADEADCLDVELDKMLPLGEFQPDEEYSIELYGTEGWKEIPSERVWTGALKFKGSPMCLYRLKGKGMSDRPFTLERSEDGTLVLLKR